MDLVHPCLVEIVTPSPTPQNNGYDFAALMLALSEDDVVAIEGG
jgi:hypothetical protein